MLWFWEGLNNLRFLLLLMHGEYVVYWSRSQQLFRVSPKNFQNLIDLKIIAISVLQR